MRTGPPSLMPVAIAVGAVGWLALGFLVGVPPDEEEYRHAVPSTLIAAEAIQRGELAVWTSRFGLGVPQPFGQSLALHPLTPLLAVVPVVVWVKLFYALHLAGAAAAMWALARRVGASPLAAAMAVATYVLATPAVNYALRDFWPSTWPVYTLAPCVVLAMLVLAEAASTRQRLRASLGLGLAAGIIGANGHQGYLIVFIPSCVALLAMHWRAVQRTWPWWLLAGAIAVVLAAPIVLHLRHELSLAPELLDRGRYTQTLTLDSLWDVFARPFGPAAGGGLGVVAFERGARVVAFGGPAALLAILFALKIRTRRDLVLAMLVPLLPLTIPGLLPGRLLSATYLFRDPLILFASLCAALALDWLRRRRPRLATLALAAQLLVLAAGVWPFLASNLQGRRQPPTEVFVGELGASSWLRDQVAASGARVYYTAGVDDLVYDAQLTVDGLWRNSMSYRGVPVVNSTVKFVSIDALAPDERIRGLAHVTHGDTTLLQIAGARWVLATAAERLSPQLERRSVITSMRGHQLVLYELPQARGAAFVDPRIRTLELPRVEGCPHDRLLCRDFARLAPHLFPGAPRVERWHGRVTVTFAASPAERLLLVGEMYRPEWTVTEPGAQVEPLLGSLVGVRVPAGSTRVTLRYRPALRAAAGAAAWFTMLAAGLIFLGSAIWPGQRVESRAGGV